MHMPNMDLTILGVGPVLGVLIHEDPRQIPNRLIIPMSIPDEVHAIRIMLPHIGRTIDAHIRIMRMQCIQNLSQIVR